MPSSLRVTPLWSLLLGLAVPVAHAEPWLCTDEFGNKTFSYDPESATKKSCVHRPIPSANVWRVRPRDDSVREPSIAFPRVDAKTQRQRDTARRQILERELEEERKSLVAAMSQLEEQQRALGGARQSANADEKLRPLREKVRLHTTNIANLQKELGRDG